MALIHYPNGAQSRLLDTASIMLSADAIRGTRLTEPALQKILGDSNTGSRIIEILSKSDENVQSAEDVKVSCMHTSNNKHSSDFKLTAHEYCIRGACAGDQGIGEASQERRGRLHDIRLDNFNLIVYLQNVDVDAPQPLAKRKASSHPSTSTKGKSAVTALKTSSTNKSSDEIEEVEPTYDARTVRTEKYSICSLTQPQDHSEQVAMRSVQGANIPQRGHATTHEKAHEKPVSTFYYNFYVF